MMLLYASLSSFHHSHLSPNLNQDHNFHRVIFILSNPKKKLPEKNPLLPKFRSAPKENTQFITFPAERRRYESKTKVR